MINIAAALTTLAACLCVQLEEDGSPELCFCGVLPGSQVSHDVWPECADDGGGMAWVRLITAYPAVAPGRQIETADNCRTSLGFDIEVGVVRHIELDVDTDPVVVAAAFEQQMKDLVSMVKAIQCCEAFDSKDAVLSQYTPNGPQGGMFGGSFTVMVHTP